MQTTALQHTIVSKIMSVKNDKLLEKLNGFIDDWILETDRETETEEDLCDASLYDSFDDWNNYLLSQNPVDVNMEIPELEYSTIEVRKFIWDSEHSGDTVSYEIFKAEIKSWKQPETENL